MGKRWIGYRLKHIELKDDEFPIWQRKRCRQKEREDRGVEYREQRFKGLEKRVESGPMHARKERGPRQKAHLPVS